MRPSIPLILVLAATGTLGCGVRAETAAPPSGFPMVVTQVPAKGGLSALPDRSAPDERYPPGSRIALVAERDSYAVSHVLSQGLAAAGAPAVSFDGDSALFAGKRDAASDWAIYEARTRGSKPRLIFSSPDRDCADPAYLAKGRIVFACDGVLYTTTRRGTDPDRITYGPGAASDPWPLRDARLVFSMRQGRGPGRPIAGRAALFAVNPDGLLLDPFLGSHGGRALKLRPRETFDRGVVFISAGPRGEEPRIERAEMGRPMHTASPLPMRVAPAAEGRRPGGLVPGSAEPLPDGALLVAGKETEDRPHKPPPTWAVYRSPATGSPRSRPIELRTVFDSPDWHEVEAVPVIERPEPRSRPGFLAKEKRITGKLICYDADRSDGRIGPKRGAPKAAAVVLARHLPDGEEELIRADVSPDGSFYLEVPPDTALRVRTFDDRKREIASSSWFWVRPGEVRSCFGCHEPLHWAPVNRRVRALERPPRKATLAEASP